MKTRLAILKIVPVLAAFVLAAGCASSGGKGQATSDSIQRTADAAAKVNTTLDVVVNALNDLTANPQPDLRPQFKAYKSAVSDLDSVASKVRSAATAMDGKAEQLMAEWDKQLALVNNEDIKARSIDRKNAVVQNPHLSGQPGRHVDTVCYVTNRNFLHAAPWPQTGPHFSTHNTMEIGYTISNPAHFERQDRHTKRFCRILRIYSA